VSAEERLFIFVYLDENVDVALVKALRQRGFHATCARDEGMLGRHDEEQLAFAARHGWTILSHNAVHFKRLHSHYVEQGWEHAGIIVAPRVTVGILLRWMINLLNRVSADEARNQLLYLQNYVQR